MYEISQEQLNQLTNLVAEMPTKFGVPVINILNTLKKVEDKPIGKSDALNGTTASN